MKNFLKMVTAVKENGIFWYNPKKGEESRQKSKFFEEVFFRAVKENNPFVFHPFNKEPIELSPLDESTAFFNVSSIDIAAPFETFSIEVMDGPITSPHGDDKYLVWIHSILAVKAHRMDRDGFIFFYLTTATKPGLGYKTNMVWAELCFEARTEEKDDGKVSMFQLFDDETGETINSIANSSICYPIVKSFIARLHDRPRVGYEKLKQKVGWKQKGKYQKTYIKKIIHVSSKKLTSSSFKSGSRTIDWSHRWESAGHYRKLDPVADKMRIGKDQNGDYTQVGRTWVVGSIKGPENAPLVKKTRLINE